MVKTKQKTVPVKCVCVLGGGSFFFKMFSQTTKPALGVLQKRKKLKKKEKGKNPEIFRDHLLGNKVVLAFCMGEMDLYKQTTFCYGSREE